MPKPRHTPVIRARLRRKWRASSRRSGVDRRDIKYLLTWLSASVRHSRRDTRNATLPSGRHDRYPAKVDQLASGVAAIIILALAVGLVLGSSEILTEMTRTRLPNGWRWLAPLPTAAISGGPFALLRPLVLNKPIDLFVFAGLCVALSLLISVGRGLGLTIVWAVTRR